MTLSVTSVAKSTRSVIYYKQENAKVTKSYANYNSKHVWIFLGVEHGYQLVTWQPPILVYIRLSKSSSVPFTLFRCKSCGKKKPTNQTNVATNQFVESCGNYLWLDKISSWASKTSRCCCKVRPTLYFLQQLSANCNNLFCCKVGLIRGW